MYDEIIEKKISNFVENQFPAFYRSEGPLFVAFVKKYYEWMESSNNTLFHTRRLLDYNDIDKTSDNFVIQFKEKYLKDIQLETTSATRELVKNSLDLYRSKGTEQSVDLLFRLVFGVGAEIYLPSDDVFRLSDGKWTIPTYIEVSLNNNNHLFQGKQIKGLNSSATAFVEKYVRKNVSGIFIDVLYLSVLSGNFQTGELINTNSNLLDVSVCPTVIGSLTDILLSVDGTGSGFKVGDVVTIDSAINGHSGKAVVTSISTITGLVSLQLLDGGYGYSANAVVLISEQVLTITGVTTHVNNTSNSYFYQFDQLVQPRATYAYTLANGTFLPGANIYTYHANGLQKGFGRIMAVSAINSIAGEIELTYFSGSFSDNTIYTTANAVAANLNVSSSGFTNLTVIANLFSYKANLELACVSVAGTFSNTEEVYQLNSTFGEIANGYFKELNTVVGSNGVVVLTNTSGVFQRNNIVRGRTSNASANVQSINLDVGVISIAGPGGSLSKNTYNYVYGASSLSNGSITFASQGYGADFSISNDFLYSEFIIINTDYLAPKANVLLNATQYAFPRDVPGNLTSNTINNMLTYPNIEFGKIRSLTSINKGVGYNREPIIKIYDPLSYAFKERDIILTYTGATGVFFTDEIVTQAATGGRGRVKAKSNATHLFIENFRVLPTNGFIITVNSTTQIVGDMSNTTANVTITDEDLTTEFIGYNAVISPNVQIGVGAITGLKMQDSGFGYINNETLSIISSNNIGTGFAIVDKQGRGSGYYQDKSGFVSDDKKIHDSNYYQEYSYEIRSSIGLDKYQDMLKQVVHVAGTRFFGAFNHLGVANVELNIDEADILVE